MRHEIITREQALQNALCDNIEVSTEPIHDYPISLIHAFVYSIPFRGDFYTFEYEFSSGWTRDDREIVPFQSVKVFKDTHGPPNEDNSVMVCNINLRYFEVSLPVLSSSREFDKRINVFRGLKDHVRRFLNCPIIRNSIVQDINRVINTLPGLTDAEKRSLRKIPRRFVDGTQLMERLQQPIEIEAVFLMTV